MRIKEQIVLLILVSLAFSCKNDTIAPVPAQSIQGQWEVIDAYRNKRQTKLLNRAYITINDSVFNTNIPPYEGEVNYSYTGNQILLNNEIKSSYKIISFSTDTMSLTTEIKGFDFELTLARKIETGEK